MAKRDSKLRSYPTKYKSKINPMLPDSEWRKERTKELYSYLPQTTLEERYQYKDIRDEVIFLNYNFFGYVASNVFIKNVHVTYEDKFQSALTHFCEMWHKYMFAEKYRTDLAFSVFFKPRLSECVYRELISVKHSTNRSLKMEAAKQLGIHYSKLRYEDLAHVKMAPDKMASLKAIFNADMEEDLENAEIFIPSSDIDTSAEIDIYSDEYNDIKGLLIHEMTSRERILNLDDLYEISDMYDIPVKELLSNQHEAEKELYDKLQEAVYTHDSFTDY